MAELFVAIAQRTTIYGASGAKGGREANRALKRSPPKVGDPLYEPKRRAIMYMGVCNAHIIALGSSRVAQSLNRIGPQGCLIADQTSEANANTCELIALQLMPSRDPVFR
ncbi:unnamed protein product [Toxocara canis]|uniref:Nitro_FeMo-Co domain-containing protein n=1 Tax=Toxocara canis TaxID=6265 RepID=A0A183U5W7_TOXCA|nr:unnamed protein product [Toxocara canis]